MVETEAHKQLVDAEAYSPEQELRLGLYELVSEIIQQASITNPEQELGSQDFEFYQRLGQEMEMLEPKDHQRMSEFIETLKFWEEYTKIYVNLEKSGPYRNLMQTTMSFLDLAPGQTCIDMGAGPLSCSLRMLQKESDIQITAIDVCLNPARKILEKTEEKLPIKLLQGSITDPINLPDEYADIIVAGLVLSYVTDYRGKKGQAALEATLTEMFRLLKPGGTLVWSTPKENVSFTQVFLWSIPDILDPRAPLRGDFTRILQGVRILKHAFEIQKKGEEGIYTFLTPEKLREMLTKLGFTEIEIKTSFAKQAYVISCKK